MWLDVCAPCLLLDGRVLDFSWPPRLRRLTGGPTRAKRADQPGRYCQVRESRPNIVGLEDAAVNISWGRIGLEARRVNKLDRAPAEFPSEVRACRQHHSNRSRRRLPRPEPHRKWGLLALYIAHNPRLTPPYLRGNRCFCRDDAGSVQLNRSAELPQTTRLPILTASRSTGIRWILRSQDGCSPRLFF